MKTRNKTMILVTGTVRQERRASSAAGVSFREIAPGTLAANYRTLDKAGLRADA